MTKAINKDNVCINGEIAIKSEDMVKRECSNCGAIVWMDKSEVESIRSCVECR